MNHRCITFVKVKRIYEISIPHFTTEGTFDAAIRQLSALDSLEIDALYLLPINPTDFENSKSPYCITDNLKVRKELDGVEGLKLFIKAAHDKGMKVILDVILNHFSIHHCCASDEDFFALDENKKPFHPIGTNWTDVYQVNHSDAWYSYSSLLGLYHFLIFLQLLT